MENKYKKGDWVRANQAEEGIGRGEILRVAETARPTPIGAWVSIEGKRSSADDGSYLESCFEPWQPKVGERVRCVRGTAIIEEGKTYTVVDGGGIITTSDEAFFVDTGKHGALYYDARYFEPIVDAPVAEQPAALKIEAGKFYKTRDGQKVGPMRASTRADLPFIANAEGESDAWYMADGTCPYIPHDDLIAEWVDTPVRDITAATVDAINDEYGPVVAVADVPKFKVGDWVTKEEWASPDGWEVAKITDKRIWLRVVGYSEPVSYELPDEDFILVKSAATAIVCKIDNGRPLPASRPHVHTSTEAADAEARRLAGIHKGKEFGVFVLTGELHKVARVYEHEWQRLAVAGQKPKAINELRKLAGLTIRGAMEAVEAYIDYQRAS